MLKKEVNVLATFAKPNQVALIANLAKPHIIQNRLVQSPPNQVVDAPLCGINEGTVALDAPDATDGLVDSTEFITSQTIPLHQVTESGASA